MYPQANIKKRKSSRDTFKTPWSSCNRELSLASQRRIMERCDENGNYGLEIKREINNTPVRSEFAGLIGVKFTV